MVGWVGGQDMIRIIPLCGSNFQDRTCKIISHTALYLILCTHIQIQYYIWYCVHTYSVIFDTVYAHTLLYLTLCTHILCYIWYCVHKYFVIYDSVYCVMFDTVCTHDIQCNIWFCAHTYISFCVHSYTYMILCTQILSYFWYCLHNVIFDSLYMHTVLYLIQCTQIHIQCYNRDPCGTCAVMWVLYSQYTAYTFLSSKMCKASRLKKNIAKFGWKLGLSCAKLSTA